MDAADGISLSVQRNFKFEAKIDRIGHADPDAFAFDPGPNRSRPGFESHFRPGDAVKKSEPGRAPGSVSAKIGGASVRIEKAPLEIGCCGSFDQDQSVGPDGNSPAADPFREAGGVVPRNRVLPIVDQDEVVPAPAHFIE